MLTQIVVSASRGWRGMNRFSTRLHRHTPFGTAELTISTKLSRLVLDVVRASSLSSHSSTLARRDIAVLSIGEQHGYLDEEVSRFCGPLYIGRGRCGYEANGLVNRYYCDSTGCYYTNWDDWGRW